MSMGVRTAFVFFAAGIFLFLVNYYLMKYFMRKAAAEGKKFKPSREAHIWGTKGRDGIVPKWVSYIGLVAFVSFFMGIFMLVFKLFMGLFS